MIAGLKKLFLLAVFAAVGYSIYLYINSEVKSGQLIALIDTSVAELELREAETSLAVYVASVQKYSGFIERFGRKITAQPRIVGYKFNRTQ